MKPTQVRRGRRRFRARAIGASLASLDARAALVPDQRWLRSVQKPEAVCCQVVTERRVAAGGTVMYLYLHEPACVIWGPAGRT
ncbi:hypothetical protein [Kitasatospora sp. MMS16-BH015]|uniref:hypothetical protein n=1 Tax=Kitasatospora sp. MMS16-BH015 TaxID=2018025 RepID=UPI000CF29E59|nr:hypothetical protein [Kitasatospora sp. MMS16-BH015]